MKKLLAVLLALVGSFVLAGPTYAAQAQQGASGDQPPGSAASAAAPGTLPVMPSGKSVMQNPTTYTNPISLTQGSERILTAGEPVIKIIGGDYYLFTRGRRGYWWSPDFVNWNYVNAPNLLGGIVGMTEIDGKLYNYAGNTNNRVMTTDDPKSGIWYEAGTFSSNNYGDASMLYDEQSGRLFMYYGWSQILGIRVVELDKHTFKEISKPQVVLWGDPHNHGWETRYSNDLIFPFFSDRQYRPQEYGWTEGPHPLKYNGKYYVLYSSIGLEFGSYAQGVYVADDPLGPYVYDQHNPLTRMISGSAPGAGHGSFFQDKQGKLWTIAMVAFTQNGGNGNTLMSLFPTDVDKEGVMHGNVEYGDYPQYLPGVKKDPITENFTGWTLLSLNKRVETSSRTVDYWPALAVDQNGKTFWSAETGNPGEYMTVDLGKSSDIRGLQIQWDRAGATGNQALTRYESYTVEVSDDKQNWTQVVDKSNNPQDLKSDYIELPTAVTGRYVRVTNVFTPDNGKFAIKEFRVFGNPDSSTYTKVRPSQLMAVRNQIDRRQADLLWQPVDGADGYIVRFGIEPNKLYQSEMVYGKNALNINSLNVDPEYYFEVEAFSSGTPQYVENPFETRGRGAELDLIKQPTGGTRTTSRQMTYETYGRDEKYVFDGITPGTYTLNHTYGVGIWGPQQLTADQLIGTDTTKPTVTALDLTQFGNGSTQWGTIEVRVYPGPASGRIEVTFHYTAAHRADQAITFDPLTDKPFGAAPFKVSAASNAGLPVRFTASGACTVTDDTVTLTRPGTCTVTASQSGDADHNPAPGVSRSFEVVGASQEGSVGGNVPATLALTLGAPASFGAFTPGVSRPYETTMTAAVTSTAGDATLSITDPSQSATGRLVNGSYALAERLQVRADGNAFAPLSTTAGSPLALLSYGAPVSNGSASIAFRQEIGSGEALRTGAYGKSLTMTLSTTTP
jgi:xylan 1,4-beta-xylosidase